MIIFFQAFDCKDADMPVYMDVELRFLRFYFPDMVPLRNPCCGPPLHSSKEATAPHNCCGPQ